MAGRRRIVRDGLVILSTREELFVQALLKGMNQTMAAIQAGCKPSSASALGTQMIQRPHVTARLAELKKKTDEARTIAVASLDQATRQNVLLDLIETRDMAKAQGNLGARLKANELLGRELGMFATKMDVSVDSPLDGLTRDALIALAAAFSGGARILEGNVIELDMVTQDVVSDTGEGGLIDPLS